MHTPCPTSLLGRVQHSQQATKTCAVGGHPYHGATVWKNAGARSRAVVWAPCAVPGSVGHPCRGMAVCQSSWGPLVALSAHVRASHRPWYLGAPCLVADNRWFCPWPAGMRGNPRAALVGRGLHWDEIR